MRSIPWAILSVMGFAITCVIALSSGQRNIEACSTTPDELIVAVEKSIAKLVRPREFAGASPVAEAYPEARASKELDRDRVQRLVGSLALDLAPERYSWPYWSTRLQATASDLGHDRAIELIALSCTPKVSAAELATISELLRVLRADARRHGLRPSAAAIDAARHALNVHREERSIPFDLAARTLAAFGDSVDQALLLAMARGEDQALRGTLFTALGYSVAPEIALELAGEPAPEAMIGLSVLFENGSWAIGEFDRARITEALEHRVRDAAAAVVFRNRALDALVSWSVDGSSETLIAVALNPEAPESLARNAAVRLARDSDHHAALEQALQVDGPRRLQLAEALASRAAKTTDAGLRGVVLEVLCRGTSPDQAPADRRRAVHALGKMPDPVALHTVAETLNRDPDPAVRAAAVVALREFPRADAERILDAAIKEDASATIRRLARHELGRHASK